VSATLPKTPQSCRSSPRAKPVSHGFDAAVTAHRLLDLITPASDTGDLPAIGKTITDKKVLVGVIDHHTLQIDRPDQVAGLIREALRHIGPERLVISSDCGMGREGMSRRHAQYKMVAMVLGTNMVRKELGLSEAECLAANPRYSLALPSV
jgi:5-methyltetrahydropteroyltriglutamate--homocysteine methyltransferase